MKQIDYFLMSILIIGFAGCSINNGYKEGLPDNSLWRKDGNPVHDQPNVKSIMDFGAALWLVDDRSLFENWNKPEKPYFDPINKVKRDTAIFTAIIFTNPTYDQSGNVDITYDLSVYLPDGELYGTFKDVTGYAGKLKRVKNALYLGNQRMGINIPNTQPSGLYTVKAEVFDNIGKLKLTVYQEFLLLD